MANKNLVPKETKAVRAVKKTEQEQVKSKVKPAAKVKVNVAIKPKKPSMVEAALQVLSGAKEPMSCKDLVQAMTTRGLWSSPNGKTPANTLYSSFLRLIQNQGKAAPIRKAEKGTFEINPSARA